MTQDKDKALEKYECVNCGKCCLFLKQQLAEKDKELLSMIMEVDRYVEQEASLYNDWERYKFQLKKK